MKQTPGVVLGIPSVPAAQDTDAAVATVPFNVIDRTQPNQIDISIGMFTNINESRKLLVNCLVYILLPEC